MYALLWALDATPSPSDTATVADDLVTPGPWGFTVMALLGIAVILLIIDMLRRIRRGSYRAQVREELDAEALSEQQADAAVRDSDVDDQDIDPSERS
ncbi:MAG: hypothetical protein QM626_09090 [Microbacterium sp.]|uniref:hypothetical protein n=1 Tax=Microbacterium sp. TaxID=51671 RepID=UPI0039E54341